MDSGVDSEVVFNTGAHEEDLEEQEEQKTPDSRIPPTPITQRDMDIIIRGWEEKFSRMTECLREVQLTSERASSDMCLVGQEARRLCGTVSHRTPLGKNPGSVPVEYIRDMKIQIEMRNIFV